MSWSDKWVQQSALHDTMLSEPCVAVEGALLCLYSLSQARPCARPWTGHTNIDMRQERGSDLWNRYLSRQMNNDWKILQATVSRKLKGFFLGRIQMKVLSPHPYEQH